MILSLSRRSLQQKSSSLLSLTKRNSTGSTFLRSFVTTVDNTRGASFNHLQQQQQQQQQFKHSFRSFSTLPPDDPQAQFKPQLPKELNIEIAEGIQNANQLILKYGVGKQRLQLLAQSDDMPLVLKWQRMMEIYLGAQLHVIASLGYETNEQGIIMYTQQLAQFISKCNPAQQDAFRRVGRDTWREMLVLAFDLDTDMIAEKYGEEMNIVDARNTIHKVASRLIEPSILETVAKRVGEIPPRTYDCAYDAYKFFFKLYYLID
jgi:chromosomal replication initiation ATPase DnaA